MATSRTPKVLWQTWKSKDPQKIPEKMARFQKGWKELHSSYAYHLLDDDDLRHVVAEVVPQYLKEYDGFTHTIERVDFARYALLYKYGGVYADMDMEVKKPIDKFVEMNKIVLGTEPIENAAKFNRKKVLCNAIMISPPEEQYWLDLMKYIIDNYEHNHSPVYTTGPMAMTQLYEKNPKAYDMLITNPCIFYPITGGWGGVSKECDIKDAYTIHHWMNTWVDVWYKKPVLWNARYWFWGLTTVYIVLWLYLYFRS